MKNIVVLISGSGSNLQAIIDNCNTKYINAEITCVISNNPDAYGLERAASANINSIVINNKDYKSRSCFDSELIKVLDDLNFSKHLIASVELFAVSQINDSSFKISEIK